MADVEPEDGHIDAQLRPDDQASAAQPAANAAPSGDVEHPSSAAQPDALNKEEALADLSKAREGTANSTDVARGASSSVAAPSAPASTSLKPAPPPHADAQISAAQLAEGSDDDWRNHLTNDGGVLLLVVLLRKT